MRPKTTTARFASLGAALLTLLGSSFALAQAAQQPPHREFVEGRSVTSYATVMQIDRQSRKLWLRDANGENFQVTAGPEVRNFDQIHEGDRVTVQFQESI